MSARLADAQVDEADILDRMAAIVTQLQGMLGDRFGQGGQSPTSSELGFDMTQSIFEVGVARRHGNARRALEEPDEEELLESARDAGRSFCGSFRVTGLAWIWRDCDDYIGRIEAVSRSGTGDCACRIGQLQSGP